MDFGLGSLRLRIILLSDMGVGVQVAKGMSDTSTDNIQECTLKMNFIFLVPCISENQIY